MTAFHQQILETVEQRLKQVLQGPAIQQMKQLTMRVHYCVPFELAVQSNQHAT